MKVKRAVLAAALASVAALGGAAAPAIATPVCTDGYKGGPMKELCGGRIFPEAALARAYVQFTSDPFGFMEYRHGIEYLAQKYPQYVSVVKLSDVYGPDAVSAGADRKRPTDPTDTNDGRDIYVVKVTDHAVPDEGKETLLYSLSVHGNERGGLEGGLRTAEDLAIAATNGGKIIDGVDNYESSTGKEPAFHDLEVKEVLKKEAVYFLTFNVDGWATGDIFNKPAISTYNRGNSIGVDLNRQMPTVGRIDRSRNPLQESEANFGTRYMRDVAKAGVDGLMAYGADIHGELNSQAYMDVMYPAGEFDSVDHRRLMAIAERTKSVVDDTLYEGIIDEIENATGGNDAEYARTIPNKPAHWATVWDSLGYTDSGFIGDYMATDLGVTGMDYEIFLNHTVPMWVWNVYLQENHINSSRAIIKTAMAYALFQKDEFNDENVKIDTKGQAGYVIDRDTVSSSDEDGPGSLAGPARNGKSANGDLVEQVAYDVTNQRWFTDTNRLMPKPFKGLKAADIAADPGALDVVDTLVLADVAAPADADGRSYDQAAYYANIKAWTQRGGNLVLTDRAVRVLSTLGVVPAANVKDVKVYQPYANFKTFTHPMTQGLRPNARQLVEGAPLGFEIGNTASPMTIVDTPAWTAAGGTVLGTTPSLSSGEDPAVDRNLDDGARTSVGQIKLGSGQIRIVGGALPMPTEANDHRYGLRNYAMTYSGLFLMENAVTHDAAGLGS